MTNSTLSIKLPEYRPLFPENREQFGIGIIGYGKVAQKWHLTAYRKYGLNLIGVHDISPQSRSEARQHPDKFQVFDTLDELLGHPEIKVVDIATRPPEHTNLILKALQTGKHVLAQKPLVTNIEDAYRIVEEAEKLDLKVAVNQNGRWAPPWRVATLLIQAGIIGEILSVTHLYDTRLSWIPTPLHGTSHFLIYDYSNHWVDITRCWMEGKKLSKVSAQDFTIPVNPEDGTVSQNLWLATEYSDGTNAVIRGIGFAQNHSGHPFWVHGTEGTIRGSVDCKTGDYVELEKDGMITRFELEGNWFPDGFAGTMGELLCAVAENREPYNSARHNLLTLETILAACRSADEGARPFSFQS